ncbi:hypothetical protein C8J57DRAFT_1227102 [Mycena rebaudengoi]|nr:hypothetical protein C8J57DRAFT_1227102 [Mycena rebaudengoi]
MALWGKLLQNSSSVVHSKVIDLVMPDIRIICFSGGSQRLPLDLLRFDFWIHVDKYLLHSGNHETPDNNSATFAQKDSFPTFDSGVGRQTLPRIHRQNAVDLHSARGKSLLIRGWKDDFASKNLPSGVHDANLHDYWGRQMPHARHWLGLVSVRGQDLGSGSRPFYELTLSQGLSTLLLGRQRIADPAFPKNTASDYDLKAGTFGTQCSFPRTNDIEIKTSVKTLLIVVGECRLVKFNSEALHLSWSTQSGDRTKV